MNKKADSEGGRVSLANLPGALLSPSLTTTVTGTFVDVTGALVTSGQVRFELKPTIATVIANQNVVEPSTVIGSISSSGQLLNQAGTGPCVVVRNTVVEPGGTYYEVSIWPEFIKTAVFNWYATQATQDLSATVPLPPVLPFVPTNVAGVIRVLVIRTTGVQPPGVSGSIPGPYTYTPTNGTTKLYVECIGGGGAGGWAFTAGAGLASCGGGGGSGGYAATFLTSPLKTSYAVAVGAGGLGTTSSAGNGGTTSFDSPASCNSTGGTAGPALPAQATPPLIYGGGSAGAGTVGDLLCTGNAGGSGFIVSGGLCVAGFGGAAPVGGGAGWGGGWSGSSAAGGNAGGNGADGGGGGGAGLIGSAARAGGNGGDGFVRIWEFA